MNGDPGCQDRLQPCGPSLGREESPWRDNRSRLDRKTNNNRGSRISICDEQGIAPCSFFDKSTGGLAVAVYCRGGPDSFIKNSYGIMPVSYTHLRAHETV